MKLTLAALAGCVVLLIVLSGCAPAATPPTEEIPAATTAAPTAEPAATPVIEEAPPTPSPVPPTEVSPTAEEEALPTAEAGPPTPTPTPAGPVWQADGIVEEEEYAHSTEAAGVSFHWWNDGEHLYAALEARTGGWVAVGLDPQDRMQGANYIFGYVVEGAAVVADMYGTRPAGPGSHPRDEDLGGTNSVLEYGGSEENGLTIIEFKIPLDSGDVYDRPLDAGATYTIILAMGSADDLETRHDARDASSITLD